MSRVPNEAVAKLSEDERTAIDLAVKGWRIPEIVRHLGGRIAGVRLRCLFREYAVAMRARAAETVAVRAQRHDMILTELIERLYRDLCLGFCKERAAQLCKYMERQSRLLGLDVTKVKALPYDEWFDTANDDELLAFLKDTYGIDLRTAPRVGAAQ